GCPDDATWYIPGQVRDHWTTLIYSYIKNGQVFACPSFKGTTYTIALPFWSCGDPQRKRSVPYSAYNLNSELLSRTSPLTMAAMEEPSRLGLIGEGQCVWSGRNCLP